MALNQVVYLPNPAATQTKTVGATLTATGAGATTLITTTAATNVRVRSFVINTTVIGDGASKWVNCVLTIGGGKYVATLLTPVNGTVYTDTVSSDELGFDGAWLQPTETVTFQALEVGGGTLTSVRIYVSVVLEEFTA